MPVWIYGAAFGAVLILANYVQYIRGVALSTERDLAKDRVTELEAANEALAAAEAARAQELAALRKRTHENTVTVTRVVDPSGCLDVPLPDELLRTLTQEAAAPDVGAKAHP